MSGRPIAAVLGAGNGGQGMAAYLVRKGYSVRLWNRADPVEEREWLAPARRARALDVVGWGAGPAPLACATTDLAEALEGVNVVAVVTTGDAHGPLARATARHLKAGQVVVLVPGKTGGALEFRTGLRAGGAPDGGAGVLVAEANTTVVNSRAIGPGRVEVFGEKRRIPLAALPATDTQRVMEWLPDLPFVAAPDVLSTSLTNFGVPLHAVPMVLNPAWIEDQPGGFLYYRQGISPSVARVVAKVDAERVRLAEALGVGTQTLQQYLVESLGGPSGDLYASIHGCAIYGTVPAPTAVDHRYLWEDVVAGIVPMVSLGRAIGQRLPLMESTLNFAEALLGRDLLANGRTVEHLGLAGLDAEGIRKRVRGDKG